MTLYEKVQLLQSLIEELKTDTALALTIQGLYTEAENIKLKDIPDLILQIRVYDFNYKFDFKALDSVGTIHTRASGISCGGMPIYPIPFELKIIEPVNLKIPTPVVPREAGVFGQNASIVTNCVFPNITTVPINFKAIASEPDQFIAPDGEDE